MRKIIIIAIAVFAVAAVICASGTFKGNDPTDPVEGLEVVPTEIAVGPFVSNAAMGFLTVSSDGNGLIYTAEAKEGYQFLYWLDETGTVSSWNPRITVPYDTTNVPFTACFGTSTITFNSFDWNVPQFGSSGVTSYISAETPMIMSITNEDYRSSIAAPGIPRHGTILNPTPVPLCSDDAYLQSVADYLAPYLEGKTNAQKAIIVLTFVQDIIDYQTDVEQYGKAEFWATPMETLYSKHGDCEDTSILFVSLASICDIDCGFVTFDSDIHGTAGTGHMSVAVALKNNESVRNAATFVVDGVTYAYGETAVDPVTSHPTLGYLSPSFSLEMAKWTPVEYSHGRFSTTGTYSLGVTTSTNATVIYGSDPVIEMRVGDTFHYKAETTIPAVITASGNGMSWLTFNQSESVLRGIPTMAGTYEVILTATAAEGPEQVAEQHITFIVSGQTSGNNDYELIYGGDGWSVLTGPISEDVAEGIDSTLIIVAAVTVIVIVGLLVVRFR
ncbi:MAG: transglutaminase domain-containing protein [Candidatus Methanomethylophilaceae archaeon]|nr:transglutaminase domain-containing protein [Candidatus Methanomethylophilaceae archaeon]